RLALDRWLAAIKAPHLDAADGEHRDQRAPRETGADVPDELRLVDRDKADQERGRERQPEQVQQAEDAPAEIGVGGQELLAKLRGSCGLVGGGGHAARILTERPGFLREVGEVRTLR